jgi:hypothetical protein
MGVQGALQRGVHPLDGGDLDVTHARGERRRIIGVAADGLAQLQGDADGGEHRRELIGLQDPTALRLPGQRPHVHRTARRWHAEVAQQDGLLGGGDPPVHLPAVGCRLEPQGQRATAVEAGEAGEALAHLGELQELDATWVHRARC